MKILWLKHEDNWQDVKDATESAVCGFKLSPILHG